MREKRVTLLRGRLEMEQRGGQRQRDKEQKLARERAKHSDMVAYKWD
jgi:hypothetical protein